MRLNDDDLSTLAELDLTGGAWLSDWVYRSPCAWPARVSLCKDETDLEFAVLSAPSRKPESSLSEVYKLARQVRLELCG
jgi:hypothetical protein